MISNVPAAAYTFVATEVDRRRRGGFHRRIVRTVVEKALDARSDRPRFAPIFRDRVKGDEAVVEEGRELCAVRALVLVPVSVVISVFGCEKHHLRTA